MVTAVLTGATPKTGTTVFDSVIGAGFELLNWQHDPGFSDDRISVPLCAEFAIDIMGQPGGHCIEPASSGTHIAIDRNGRVITTARTPVETNLCQKRITYIHPNSNAWM
jgi:hypothetical protein